LAFRGDAAGLSGRERTPRGLGLGAPASFSVLAGGCGLCDYRSESDGVVDPAWAPREHQQRLTDDPLVKAGVDDVFGDFMQVEIIKGRGSARDVCRRRVVAQSELLGVLRGRGGRSGSWAFAVRDETLTAR
jgi:hypothetical protein